MTRQEISERYCVSAKVLDAYERCLAGNKDGQKCSAHHHYTEQDLAQISLLLTLHDLGFSSQEAQEYMRLCQCRYETSRRRLAMLEKGGLIFSRRSIGRKSSWIVWIICVIS